jgi:hypothetical protein
MRTASSFDPALQPAGDAIAAMIQATLTPILGPLVAELAASRQANERSQDRVAALERENGRQGAELAAVGDGQVVEGFELSGQLARAFGPHVVAVLNEFCQMLHVSQGNPGGGLER